jgi:hypothetical protein
MQNIYILLPDYRKCGKRSRIMEKTKASFQIDTPLWREFLKVAKFQKNSNASALLRGFVQETVGEKA